MPVGHPDFGEAFPCGCRARRPEDQAAARRHGSNLGPLTRVKLADLNPDGPLPDPASQRLYRQALQAAREFAGTPRGWLAFAGPSGCGKTWLMAAIVNAALEQGQAAYFTATADLLDQLRSAYGPEPEADPEDRFSQFCDLPLLALDDLNAQNATPWAREKLYQLLNHRHVHGRTTLLTVQGPPERLEDRLLSRVDQPASNRRLLRMARGGSNAARRLGVFSPHLRRMTLENFDRQGSGSADPEQRRSLERAWQAAKAFAADPQGWLALSGPRGCGKTHLLAGIAARRAALGQEAFRAFVPDLLDYLRSSFDPRSPDTYEELFEEVKTAPLLLLDDLSLEDATPWAKNKLDQLLIYRYDQGLPLALTTLYTVPELERESPAIGSRMVDSSLVETCYITAPNYRRPQRRENPGKGGNGSPSGAK